MKRWITFLACLLVFSSCNLEAKENKETKSTDLQQEINYPKENLTKAYFASGCFWCVEAVFESVKGVQEAISGYAGGHTDHPTYRQIGTGNTGHAESVEVIYDSTIVDYETLLKVYYGSHNPTTVEGQNPDYGPQYRSVIFYTNQREKEWAEKYKAALQSSGEYDQPIVTEIVAYEKFWPAEDYHQNYERLHPNESYVRNVSIPRLKKFQSKFPELLK